MKNDKGDNMKASASGVKMIGVKLDPARDRFVRDKARDEKRPVTSVVAESIDFLFTRELIEKHVRDSVAKNRMKYRTLLEFLADVLHDDTAPTAVRTAMLPIDYDRWVMRETFNVLREWTERGYDTAWLERTALESECYFPRTQQEWLDFAETTRRSVA